jgi:hypothetical protein
VTGLASGASRRLLVLHGGGGRRASSAVSRGDGLARGHLRGARRNNVRHQWRLSIGVLRDRKGMGQRRLLKRKMRGGQAATYGAAAPAGAVVARTLSDEGDDPELTDRVGPPAVRGRRRPNRTSGVGDSRIGQAEQAMDRLGWTGREEVGRG